MSSGYGGFGRKSMGVGAIIGVLKDRKEELRRKFFGDAGLHFRIRYDDRFPFKPRTIGVALMLSLGVAAERVILEEIMSCFDNDAQKAMNFMASRGDLVRALHDARLYRDDLALALCSIHVGNLEKKRERIS